MTDGFDPRAELAHVHDAPGAWSFIRGFTSHSAAAALTGLYAAMPGGWWKLRR